MRYTKGHVLKAVRTLLQKGLHQVRVHYYVLLAMLFCPMFIFADGNDLLAPASAEVSSTFGQGSTLWIVIYTLEILAAGYSFIIKKSLPAFLGVVAMIVFTTVAFKIIPTGTPS